MMVESNAQIGYGEATKGSMENIINVLKEYGLDNASSHVMDIGSGFGKPAFHSAIKTLVTCYGIELVPARVEYCIDLVKRLTEEYKTDKLVGGFLKRIQFTRIDAGNIHRYQNEDGIDSTHFYSFNWVMSEEDNKAIVDALNETEGF